MMSGGNPEGKQKAQGTMTWAAIGFIFVFLAKSKSFLLLPTLFHLNI